MARLLVLAGVLGVRNCAAEVTPSELAARLAQIDASIIPENERQAAARMIEEDVEQRLRKANEASSAEWKRIASREDWERFRTARLSALRESLGEPEAAVPLLPRVTGSLSGEGYKLDNVVFQSRAGFWITANLYRPEPARSSMPGIIISHAHHTPKEHGELQDMGVIWARAGCLVLVPDHLGHGERRQHPFRSASDYARSFQVSRQDYFFRYDTAMQLHLVGESLIGWMARDLMRGVDLLLAQENIDRKRIILLGAVAGGGDPAAVTAALDERITAAVPFNFGGPQPETRFPLPEDAETSFDYAGGGSWESTRNLCRSAADGFLPWVIVGGIAPRHLFYGHEFSWDRERDPVWKRLQTIFGFYQSAGNLAFAHGRGGLRGQPPEASHCTHIGPPHRKLIHEAFAKWFGITVTEESSDRHAAQALRAMTADAERELRPKILSDVLVSLAEERMGRARARLSELPPEQRRRQMQGDWTRLLGSGDAKFEVRSAKSEVDGERKIAIERVVLTVERSLVIPVLVLKKPVAGDGEGKKRPVVVIVSQAGKQTVMREQANEIAALLERGAAVCIPDVRGTGETRAGKSRGRRSAATSLSSSELMLGGTTLGAQLRDLRAVYAWLRTREDTGRISVWGESSAKPNPPGTDFKIPRDDDDALPRSPEPMGGLLALLSALYEDDVRAVYVHGGLAGMQSVLTNHLALLPHDAVVPGALTTGDLSDLVAVLAPRKVRLEEMVDGWNRVLSAGDIEKTWQSAVASYRASNAGGRFSFSAERTTGASASWLLDN